MVDSPAFAAASASYGVSPTTTASRGDLSLAAIIDKIATTAVRRPDRKCQLPVDPADVVSKKITRKE